MLFNSLAFLAFFPIVCLVYYLIPSLRWRNMFLLVASYYFYMNWEPVYALLLLTSTGVTYLAALGMERYADRKKCFLWGSLAINLLILFFFKYYNWMGENVTAMMQWLGVDFHVPEFRVLLPVGISFYIFQALGYSIDVYRKELPVERNFWRYALFVSFFPQLVAGPIERSTNLLQQFKEKKPLLYDNVMKGINIMLWGYFLKLAVADRCAMYVDAVFNNATHHTGGSFAVAAALFPFQLYGDFAGYSLIAIGAARVMGFSLMQNFNHPYFFSVSIQDYWKRNHISLTTWFMDYVYYPMVGSSTKVWWWCFCIFFTFFVSGFWHGAAWTYVLCFSLHGLCLVWCTLTQKAQKKWEKRHGLKDSAMYHGLQRVLTFVLLALLLIFFRANSIEDGFYAVKEIFTDMHIPYRGLHRSEWGLLAINMLILFAKEYMDEFGHDWHLSTCRFWIVRHVYIVAMTLWILLWGILNGGQFIYFQF